jgi:hypothetical protein
MTRIRIQTAVPYDVEIGAGVAAAAPQFFAEFVANASSKTTCEMSPRRNAVSA